MTCPVILHRTSTPCGEPLYCSGLCQLHYGRRCHGWRDDELGLPRGATRKAPPRCRIVEAATKRPCPRPHVATGLCRLHYDRKKKGWSAQDIAQPPGYQRVRPSAPKRTCTIVMDDGDPCGDDVEACGACDLHYQRIKAGWPAERLGEPRRGTPRCGARTDLGPCRNTVAVLGDQCADHADDGHVRPPRPARTGTRRPMTTVDKAAVDASAVRLVARHRNRASTAQGNAHRMREFREWSERHGVSSVAPVSFTTVARYLASLTDPAALDPGRNRSDPYSFSLIRSSRSAIRDAHLAAGHPSPTDHPDMPALWRGIRRRVGDAPRQTTQPITRDLMHRIMSAPPKPSRSTLVDVALLRCVRQLGVDPSDLAGAEVRLVESGVCHIELGGGDERPVAHGATGAALRKLCRHQEHGTWSFDADPRTLADRQARLLARAGLPVGRRARHVQNLSEVDFEHCVGIADADELRWRRDRAFMLLAWHLCLEHHEWSLLRWDVDLVRTPTGYTVQLATGTQPATTLTVIPTRDPVLCAVRALDELRSACAPASGDLVFPGRIPSGPIPVDAKAAGQRMKVALGRIQVAPAGYATSSLTYGFIVTAVELGADEYDLARTARITTGVAVAHIRRLRAPQHAAQRMRAMTEQDAR